MDEDRHRQGNKSGSIRRCNMDFVGGLILGLSVGFVIGIYLGACAIYTGAKVLDAIRRGVASFGGSHD